MNTSQIEIVHIPEISKATLANLMQIYMHDLSEFSGDLVNEDGLYSLTQYFDQYWQEPERHPFFIKSAGAIVGFALVRELEPGEHSIAEFFVVRSARRGGVGTRAAFQIFDQFPGRWHVAQDEGNVPAQRFWLAIIEEYTGGNFEQTTSDAGPRGPMQVFSTRAAAHD